ncbi:hypothetical protein M9H77_06911 [Catharanthus roseus]|uniref:Uncharacterized protein n=1 Tax=Catharanthus roseus TaxID=4058 RepID=A0ACC0BTF5_CATRO|nr:hypothetical protein M9H77_06911 [Catharanthus roseus]
MIKHMIEDSLASRVPTLLPKVLGNILAKVLKYYKRVVTQPPTETLFGLFVTTDYLDIKGLLSLTCKDVFDMTKRKDPEHIRKIFNITPDFSPKEEEKIRRENPWAFNDALGYSEVRTEEAQSPWEEI